MANEEQQTPQYEPPVLVEHGTIEDLTEATGAAGPDILAGSVDV
jgi:hypothetical protein